MAGFPGAATLCWRADRKHLPWRFKQHRNR
jgi:hypothetical protein